MCGSAGKESACNAGDLGSIRGWEDLLEKEMEAHSIILTWKIPWMGEPGRHRGKESACNAGDLGLILGWEDPLEKEMAPHSSTLAWKIPWTEEPGGLQSMGSLRVGHD